LVRPRQGKGPGGEKKKKKCTRKRIRTSSDSGEKAGTGERGVFGTREGKRMDFRRVKSRLKDV